MVFSDSYFALAVSDVHLGFIDNGFPNPKPKFAAFLDDIEKIDHIEHFIILGDFIDLWRRNDFQLLMETNELLNRLVKMKSDGKIKNLHYLVGNHDYKITWYMKIGFLFRNFSKIRKNLKHFSIKKASVTDQDFLTLEAPNSNFYSFRHGHQDDNVISQVPEFYDIICFLLCSSGNLSGRLFSWIWTNKYYLPHMIAVILAFLSIYRLVVQDYFLFGVLGLLSIVALAIAIWTMRTVSYQATKDAKRQLEETDKKIEKFQKGLEKEGREQKAIQQDVRQMRVRYQEEIFEQLRTPEFYKEQMSKIRRKRPIITLPTPQKYSVIGHTHHAIKGPPIWNTGAWVEDSDCRCFAITSAGIEEFHVI